MDDENQEKLTYALQLCEYVIELLDRAYLAHCEVAGVTPDPEVVATYS